MNQIKQAIIATAIATTSMTNIAIESKPADATTSYDASGQWRCVQIVEDITRNANTTSDATTLKEFLLVAHANGTFEAQGTQKDKFGGGAVRPFVALGNWSIKQTPPDGTGIFFQGQMQLQDSVFGVSKNGFAVAGVLQNQNSFAFEANTSTTYQKTLCQR